MHPAISVIFFTVTSGAGFGLMGVLGLGIAMSSDPIIVFLICSLAGSLAIAGLLASTFHLGHPERALRAFSQWRSSWLSREGIAAVVTLMLFGVYTLIWLVTGVRILTLGLLVTLGAVLTVFTTAMIYGQLKTIPHWNTPMTAASYLGFSLASGYLLAAGFTTQSSILGYEIAATGFILIILAWAIKIAWWLRAGRTTLSASGSTTGSATGLDHIGKVRLLEKPHSGQNYLTREMVHQVGRKHAQTLRMIALITGLIIPAMVCLMVYLLNFDNSVLLLAAVSLLAGLFAERWLFFAEAEHTVSLYY